MKTKEYLEQITDLIKMDEYPTLPCPFCSSDSLKLDPLSYQHREMSMDKLIKLYEKLGMDISTAWDKGISKGGVGNILGAVAVTALYLYAEYHSEHRIFNCFFSCSQCNESISATGFAREIKEKRLIKVTYFSTPILFFEFSENLPDTVKEELLLSFSYFHSDILASGHKLRRAIEQICNALGYTNEKNGKNLNRKLDLLSKDFPKEGKWLKILKDLGNDSSHVYDTNASEVQSDDLLQSFECIEHVLKVFDRIADENKLIEKVNTLEEKFTKKNKIKQIVK